MLKDWFSMPRGSRTNDKPRHPLSDPLEGEEWRGLQWTATLFSRLICQRRR